MHDLNAMAREIHEVDNHKWWHTPEGVRLTRDPGELLMLAVSELSEAMEGVRKSKPGAPLMDDKIITRRMEEVEMADFFIRLADTSFAYGLFIDPDVTAVRADSLPDNKAAALLEIVKMTGELHEAIFNERIDDATLIVSEIFAMVLDYCDKNGLDLFGAISEKRQFNAVRSDHSYAARAAAGGKAF